MDYRLYLLDADRRIAAAHGFLADDDQAARENASVVFDACDDAVHGYELWSGATIIVSDRGRTPSERLTLAALSRERQAMICQHEEIMRDSFACLRKSTQLAAILMARHTVSD